METSDIKKNTKILIDGQPYTVVDFQHVKPGKGNAFSRCRVKNLITGQVIEKTWKSGENLEVPDVEFREMQYLYPEGDMINLMDNENYEQISVPSSAVGDQLAFLQENMVCGVLFFNGKPINIELPTFVVLPIVYTEPGFKGDTATGATKPATVQGGHKLTVPLHMKEGDLLKIDTRTGEYVERVNK